MRAAGFTLAALLIAGSVGVAQPPAGAVPGQPVPPAQVPVAKADPQLDGHLAAWEKKMVSVVNLRTEVALTRTDSVSQKSTAYSGQVLCMKPNFAVLRLNNNADKTNTDYEAYICNGRAVYAYSGLAKTVTEIELPKAGPGVDNLMLDFLAGMKAKDVKERFDINLFKTDENYIYLDIKPRFGKDQLEFKHLRLALYGPGAATRAVAYLPAQVFMLKANDDTEVWKFSNPMVDIPGVKPEHFQYVEIKEKGWTVSKAVPQPVGGNRPVPAGGTGPAGGAVRRDK
ncbi:hypothetical protein GobsT_25180 [Gemmata obscuriglobus]|uniref:TIGR03009 domain-containing protein n=1 Tax=Gemmata obscuriglobus TaxID=114 RepID=A0A2Z3H875_9BACT|nr:TIGR03009 domain-containing protein [Gemmata obscuriglobus]AWM39195.1 TIGR03009 domain-containing protein [Gemmata obscuriglobus]QEG27755.1 hypothetical protein GobsT_25180 [Gemmata obscuriglobus]VTS05036.1 Hypothetical conserved protein OS=uncultured planctomycete GN=HGMM_F37F03C09 PE=4 SV=1 [Gemmata obscuriglobus UQM 2246]